MNQLRLTFWISVILITVLSACGRTTYKGTAGSIQTFLDGLSDQKKDGDLRVSCDSLEIFLMSNPTRLKYELDTIIEEPINEEDFVVVEYNSGRKLVQLVNADDLRYQHIKFENSIFYKNELIGVERTSCTDNDDEAKCRIIVSRRF